MRYTVKVYDDGTLFAVETTDDGSAIVRTLQGQREVGKRLSAFVEVLSDDSKDGVARLQQALKFLNNTITQGGSGLRA